MKNVKLEIKLYANFFQKKNVLCILQSNERKFSIGEDLGRDLI